MQAGLQRLGGLGAAAQHPAHRHGQRQLLGDLLDQAHVGQAEVARAGSRARVSTPCVCSLSASGTLSTDPVPSRASSGTPPGAAPRMSLSSAWVTSIVLPDSRTWAGSEPGSGLTAATVCGQLPGLVLVGPGDVVPPEQPAPVHVHDDPRPQRLGQQPGAALQGHRLAEGDVLQQEAAGRGGQVEPPGHHRHHRVGPGLLRCGDLLCPGLIRCWLSPWHSPSCSRHRRRRAGSGPRRAASRRRRAR